MAKTASKKPSKGGGGPMPKVEINLKVTAAQAEELLETLRMRFEKNMKRHHGLEWSNIRKKLKAQPKKLASLHAMESTGGEPDVVGFDKKTGEFIFMDCSAQSPKGRRNTCYDGAGQKEREKQGIHPAGNAVDMAAEMGIELLDEAQYRALQKVGEFDTTTSSWILTPPDIRALGGAIFADRRFEHVFVYHNTAGTFYGGRGFRGMLRV